MCLCISNIKCFLKLEVWKCQEQNSVTEIYCPLQKENIKIWAVFDILTKYNIFYWVFWFLAKTLSTFLPLPLKIDNPYYQNPRHLCWKWCSLFVDGILCLWMLIWLPTTKWRKFKSKILARWSQEIWKLDISSSWSYGFSGIEQHYSCKYQFLLEIVAEPKLRFIEIFTLNFRK